MEAKSKAQVGPTCSSSFVAAMPCLWIIGSGLGLKLGSQIRVKVYRFRLKLTVRVQVKVRRSTAHMSPRYGYLLRCWLLFQCGRLRACPISWLRKPRDAPFPTALNLPKPALLPPADTRGVGIVFAAGYTRGKAGAGLGVGFPRVRRTCSDAEDVDVAHLRILVSPRR